MPELKIDQNKLVITSVLFSVIYKSTRPHHFTVHLSSMTQDFFIPASCDSLEQRDLNIALVDFRDNVFPNFVRLSFKYKSSLWEKIYYLDIYDSHIEFYYDLFGKHRISNLHFFEGISALGFEEHYFTKHFNDRKTTPYREYSVASPVNFKKVFNPEPNVYSKQYFEFFEYSQISVNSDFVDYCGGNFLFNPGILCFSISKKPLQEWLSLGIAVKSGEYLFSDFEYIGGAGFGLNLNYCGLLEVKDHFRTPKVVMHPGKTEIETLEKYVTSLRNWRLVSQPRHRTFPNWWYGPIICPVGYQYYQTDLFRVRSPKERPPDLAGYFMCTQVNYEHFVNLIDRYNLDWKILIIDVKWFINAGLKIVDIGRWPNMRGFVQKLHDRGKKVLIWWGPWDTEGWNVSECITYSEAACGNYRNRPGRFSKFDKLTSGTKMAPDITLPSVKEKVKRQLERLLGSENDGIDLDGLKLDHTAATPSGYGLQFPKGSKQLYGVEMLRYYHEFLFKTVKHIKSDALIIGQSSNPYFIDCIDMIRLGDTYCHTRNSVVGQMSFRHKMVKIVNPYWLIDMDNWPMPSLTAFHEYAEFQVQHGVPSLYYATHIDTTGEKIPAAEFERIRVLWEQYRANLKPNIS